jgi:UDP-2,3-diacylglucosamine hydrolase
MATSSGRPLAIIAGGGSVPLHVAAAALGSGRKVLVLGIEGEADARIVDYPHEWINWGQIGRLEKLLAAHGTRDIVLIGGVKSRPDFKRLRPDLGTVRLLPRLISMMASGDNTVLTGTIRIFEEWGYSVVGAHEVSPDLVAAPGIVAGPTPRSGDLDDVRLAIAAARGIGVLDAGQAAVAMNGRVVALEASEGTDGMLERVAALRAHGRLKSRGPAGVLAKCAKPQQDLRVDMPTIGPETVTGAAKAGLAGIAIESGRVMIADRTETERRTKEAGLFVFAVGGQAAA